MMTPPEIPITREHYPGCWRSHGHHNCAADLLQRLTRAVREYYFADGNPIKRLEARRVVVELLNEIEKEP